MKKKTDIREEKAIKMERNKYKIDCEKKDADVRAKLPMPLSQGYN